MATIPVRLDENCDYEKINRLFKDIETKGKEHLINDGFNEEEIDIYRSMEMRYLGQIHECTVNIETFDIDNKTIEKVKDAFHKRHEELYTYSELQSPVELVNIESTLYGRIDRPDPSEIESDTLLKEAIKSSRNLIFSNSGESIKTPVYDGNFLSDGHQINGPAVVEEDTTTLVIEPGWLLKLHKSGTYIINRKNH
tara:strand:- start:603 stop:1190 length:588 start_codon:yes stop_codon:yes gene_type:complete